MARLYAATGDAIARLDEDDGVWWTAISLDGSGGQCLALDPFDAGVVYAVLREGGVRSYALPAAWGRGAFAGRSTAVPPGSTAGSPRRASFRLRSAEPTVRSTQGRSQARPTGARSVVSAG